MSRTPRRSTARHPAFEDLEARQLLHGGAEPSRLALALDQVMSAPGQLPSGPMLDPGTVRSAGTIAWLRHEHAFANELRWLRAEFRIGVFHPSSALSTTATTTTSATSVPTANSNPTATSGPATTSTMTVATTPTTTPTAPTTNTTTASTATAGGPTGGNGSVASSSSSATITPTSPSDPPAIPGTTNVVPFSSGSGSGTVTIEATDAFAAEGATNYTPDPGEFTITANPIPTTNLIVSFAADPKSTAIGNTDYTLSSSSSVTISAGTNTATIKVYPQDDLSLLEFKCSESVVLDLTGVTSSGSGSGSGSGCGSGGTSYSISSPSQATVTIRDEDVGVLPWLSCTCPCSCSVNLAPSTSSNNGNDPSDKSQTKSGSNPGNGVIGSNKDGLLSSGFGELFGQSLEWTNLTGLANNSSFGIGMVDSSLPTIQQTQNGGVMVATSGDSALWFDPGTQSGTYVGEFFTGTEYSLQPDGSSGDFVLTDGNGDQLRFYGFESSLPAAQQGQFKSFTDPEGNTIAVTAHTTDGQIGEVQRSGTTNGVTTTESYVYTYITSGVNTGLVSNVTLRRQVNGGAWSTVRQAVYTYYDGTQPEGNPRDLETEQIEDASNNVLDTTYFRYYTPGEANGYTDGLEYYFTPESYARLAAAVGNPLTASDAQVAPYADHYYQYDSQQRVTLATVQGAGATGPGTYTYTYTTSSNPSGYNSWQTKTVETDPDGNQDIYYTNSADEVMLDVTNDVSDPTNPALQGKQWLTLDRYDSQGRLIEEAEPSAVNGYSDSYADLMNFQNGTSTYLNNTTGVINLYDYGTSTTATSTTPGDVLGYAKDDKVQVGQSGTPILLDSEQYIAHTANGVTVYPQASSTVYRNSDGTGAETTTDSYTWFSGTNQVQSDTTTAPVISAAENGPGTADTTTVYYDTYGRPIWTMDGDGYIDYTAYDNATGAVVTSITDVNTADTGEFSNLPAGWTTPSGGGLNLVTQTTVDALGRPTEVVDPNGNIDYYVYDDVDHEVREYDGWNSTTDTTTGPTIVTREDYPGSYFETLTMSAAPHVTNGVPDGTEPISNIQTLERDYTDTAGRVIETDQYFNLNGVTYSTAAHIGTLGTNYYATYYGFDESGNPQRSQDANGTITDTLYDGLDRPTAVYVGTNDSTTNGQPWSPANASTASNMTLVEQDQYDNNGVGDGNLTQTIDYPDTNANDNRVTQNAYDDRDRLVATKSGVQTTEDNTTHRPIIYYDLDNLGEVTAVSQYDGDGVTLTSTKPSASLLRAYAVTSYDDQGQVYQTQQYDVNQTTGAVSSTALTTNDYYDHRGDQIAESDPGGLWTKDQYDGAGRLISEAQTDGGGGTTWAAAGSLTGDQVVTQVLTTYDADGNPILVADKERFNTDTVSQTGPLGNPSTGPQARVYYTASYYDAANRLTASVDVGTFGGTAYTRPSTVPADSDTTLVTGYGYNAAGRVQSITDPRGIVNQTSYDALGRVTQTIDDYTNGTPTASTNSTTNYTYDGMGDVLTVQAVMPSGTPSQTTQYVYGVTTAGGSGLNSNDLLATVENPDPSTGSPSTSPSNDESYTYNAVGDTLTDTDPNGTTHTYSYDVLGRQTADAVTTLGAGVDGSVLRLTTAYDTGDRPYLYTSYNAASGGSVVNQVEDAYNGLGQLTGEYQEHNGAVNTSTTPEVQYVYTEMSGGQNNSRLTQMIYPNGRTLDYVYNAGLDSSISRLGAIADDNNGSPGTTLEAYAYLGLGTIVQESHPQTGVNLTYLQQPNDPNANTDGGDQYTGLDRFGRVIDQNYVNTATGTSTDRFQYGYDRADEVLYKNNLVNSADSELYHANSTQAGDNSTAYDPLGRLTAFARGTLSASGHNGSSLDTIASPSASQSWGLDALGNFSSQTSNGTATTRTFNAQNETIGVSGGTAPAYNNNGDTTSDSGLTFVYDAWDRLVAAQSGGTTVAAYGYDALGRRITETYSGTSTTNNLYYSPQWQVIEERQNGTSSSNVTSQYVWGAADIDQMVLRDSYSGGVLQPSSRLYVQQDANDNVTALVNTSGQVVERYLYSPYGSVTVLDASWNPLSGNQSAYGWQYLFQGGRLDAVTGWYSFRNRDLIPSEGRWAERDPLGLSVGDPNLYRDVSNEPTNFTDPSGLAEEPEPGFFSLVAPNRRCMACHGTGVLEGRSFEDLNPTDQVSILAALNADESPLVRIGGGVRVVGGTTEIAAATPLLLAPELLTKLGAGALGLHGLDNIQTGFREACTGKPKDTGFAQGVGAAAQYGGASPEVAMAIGRTADLGVGILGPAGLSALGRTGGFSGAGLTGRNVGNLRLATEGAAGTGTGEISDLLQQIRGAGGTLPISRGQVTPQEVAALTRATGNEFAIYRLTTKVKQYGQRFGQRFICELGPVGGDIPDNSRLLLHSQPGSGPLAVRPSAIDRATLQKLGQHSSVIINAEGTFSIRFGQTPATDNPITPITPRP